ncbi:type VI secretion system membrane subunit TssM [Inquilinus sp. CA228]|uniref:type VI secretion system membrane subunit TssM n=1 Tax=Inquilinus sp. CA228 TaxID=3455609 RepID=UPI003F8D4653
MYLLLNVFSRGGLFRILGMLGLGVLVWMLGTSLHVFGRQPLLSPTARIATFAAIVACYLLYLGFRLWHRYRSNRRLVQDLTKLGGEPAAARFDRADGDMTERFDRVKDVLRSSVDNGRGQRNFLYQMPWYVVIGAAGTGKTTLLRNSGLRFPLADQLGMDGSRSLGGTANCDWWITDQAVLIDTAGRFLSETMHQELDRGEWQSLLALLKRHRPRQPLNGVILTLSAVDLLGAGSQQSEAQTLLLRRKLQELLRTLGMQLPVYLVVTKCDVVSGFTESMELLPQDRQSQSWGIAVPTGFEFRNAQSGQIIADGLDSLQDRTLAQRTAWLGQETDIGRLHRIFAFPEQLAAFLPRIAETVLEVFWSSRYEVKPQLRGIFLTSARPGEQALDSVVHEAAAQVGIAARRQIPAAIGEQAFFVRGVFEDFVFAEQGLASFDPRLERRRRRLHLLAYTGAAAAIAAMTLVWAADFAAWQTQLSDTERQAQALETNWQRSVPNVGPQAILPLLDQTHDLGRPYSGWWFGSLMRGAGLSIERQIIPHTDALYGRVLRAALLPELRRELQDTLQRQIAANDTNGVFRALPIYLMLGDAKHYDANRVAQWFDVAWRQDPQVDPKLAPRLSAHLQALLPYLPVAQGEDSQLVTQARNLLLQFPPARTIYNEMKRAATGDSGLPAFHLDAALAPQGPAALTLTGSPNLSLDIPGLYTRAGFEAYVLRRLPREFSIIQQDQWILGDPARRATDQKMLLDQVATLYAEDYVASWMTLTQRVELRPFRDAGSGLQVLGTLSGVDSPLDKLVGAIAQNTDLAAPPPPPAAEAPTTAAGAAEAAAKAIQTPSADQDWSSAFSVWPGERIRSRFTALIAMSGRGDHQQATTDQAKALVGGAVGLLQTMESSLDSTSSDQLGGTSNSALVNLRSQAPGFPTPVDRVLTQVAANVSALLNGLKRRQIDGSWRDSGDALCKTRIAGRFPVDPNGQQDIALNDFVAFFGPGGTLERFEQQLQQSEGDTRAASRMADVFAQGARVRSAFFNGDKLGFGFTISPTYLDPRALRSTLQVGDQRLVYQHEPPPKWHLEWPPTGQAGGATLILTDLNGKSVSQTIAGPWALFRLLGRSGRDGAGIAEITVALGDLKAEYSVTLDSGADVFNLQSLTGFRCP